MNPLVDEYRTGSLARTLLLLHGPARRRTLCSMMYLADADHYELYEDEISWTPCIMTEDGPEHLGFDDVISIRQLGSGGTGTPCGRTAGPTAHRS